VNTTPNLPYYAIRNFVTTQDKGKRNCDALLFTRPLGSKELHLDGDMPAGAEPCIEHVAVQDPAEYAALALKAALERRGVRITGTAKAAHSVAQPESTGAPSPDPTDFEKMLSSPGSPSPCKTTTLDGPEPTVIARHRSPTLIEDIVYTNKVSQNLHAELLLRNLGERITCEDSARNRLHAERLFLEHAGINPKDFMFNDGSGLSNHDLVTPRAIAKLLQFANTQPWFADWKTSLPVGGEDGTLGGRFAKPPLKDHLFAKTGTLGEARALSGYLDAASGRTVIFSIMVDNHLPGTTADRDTMDKIVAAIQAAE
jgi:serine-type D-Ala-D-Ala carboxypeptidase/endopeptidase (penicillin-binding protein 4)